MIEIDANRLKVGDEFTTRADGGEVWFKVLELTRGRAPIDVHGEVVQANPGLKYSVGQREWMDLGPFEKVIVR